MYNFDPIIVKLCQNVVVVMKLTWNVSLPARWILYCVYKKENKLHSNLSSGLPPSSRLR